MKKFACLFSVIFGILFAGSASAASVTTISLGDFNAYIADFNVRALDFRISVDEPDILDTFSVNVNGGGVFFRDYFNVQLWMDTGDDGFQGWGYDQFITQAPQIGAPFIFSGLNVPIVESERFFVTIDIGTTGFPPNTIEFILTPPNDFNGDDAYQEGESGVFLESGVISSLFGGNSRRISLIPVKADVNGPKSFFNDISNDVSNPTLLVPVDGVVNFSGGARDRHAGLVDSIQLFIGDDIIVDALGSGATEIDWTAEYEPEIGLNKFYTIRANAVDGLGKPDLSGNYYIQIDSREMSLGHSTVSATKSEVVADGSDSLLINVDILDSIGNGLEGRVIDYVFFLDGEEFVNATASTDDGGRASLQESFGLAGNYVVKASLNGVIIGQVGFVAVDEDIILPEDPEEQDEPLQEGIKPGDLIKGTLDAVYFYSTIGKRHVFVNQAVYESWYGTNFDSVVVISDELLASITLGMNVGYRPGSMLTSPSVNEVFLVTRGQSLRHLPSEKFAKNLFGDTWNKMIHDLPESLLFGYDISDPFAEVDTVNLFLLQDEAITIDDEIALRS
jgi:hypothetical protein